MVPSAISTSDGNRPRNDAPRAQNSALYIRGRISAERVVRRCTRSPRSRVRAASPASVPPNADSVDGAEYVRDFADREALRRAYGQDVTLR